MLRDETSRLVSIAAAAAVVSHVHTVEIRDVVARVQLHLLHRQLRLKRIALKEALRRCSEPPLSEEARRLLHELQSELM